MTPVEVTVTCASAEEAGNIMRAAVEKRLAACCQTWPIRSCYRWEGKIETEDEHLLLLKTAEEHFEAICELICSLHSYDLPSIVMIPLSATGPGYLEWLIDSVARNPR